MYAQAAGRWRRPAGRRAGGRRPAARPKDDDVVDAEFTEVKDKK
jgi:hypothetical protein